MSSLRFRGASWLELEAHGCARTRRRRWCQREPAAAARSGASGGLQLKPRNRAPTRRQGELETIDY
jgi:hypothetical protein